MDYTYTKAIASTLLFDSADEEDLANFHDIEISKLLRVEVEQQFSDVRLLAENSTAKVYVARHLQSGRMSIVLKCLHKNNTTAEDFFREYHYNCKLSIHPNIVTCFDEAFQTDTDYVFTQEFAPVGDLLELMKREDFGELMTKSVTEQIAFALEFMHQRDLVHGDICLENIFIFDHDLSWFKLGDFGNTQRVGAFVKKSSVRSPWAPPEVILAVDSDDYQVQSSHDAWQLGVLIFVCLTGSYPWSLAYVTDCHYNSWVDWLRHKTTKTPPRFRCFTPRLLRLLRRLLEPRPEKRSSIKEVHKYLPDAWLTADFAVPNKGSDHCSSSEPSKPKKRSLFSRTEAKLAHLLRSQLRRCWSHNLIKKVWSTSDIYVVTTP